MYVKNVFNEAEQRMIEAWNENARKICGWVTDERPNANLYGERQIDFSAIKNVGVIHDAKNRLYRDPAYASESRWGGVIASPFFIKRISCGLGSFVPVPPEAGVIVGSEFGEDYKWYTPIRPGDNIRVFQGLCTIQDDTPEGGPQKERAIHTVSPVSYYNQRDELVAQFFHHMIFYYTDPENVTNDVMRFGYEMDREASARFENIRKTPMMRYTPEQIRAFDEFYANEPRRGNVTLFWEDVKIGEELPPTIMGPLTVWDNCLAMATHMNYPLTTMEFRRLNMGVWTDPETNIPYTPIEIHVSDSACDLFRWYSPSISETVINPCLLRTVSNWAGDDAFFRSFRWRKGSNTNWGDTFICRGTVMDKYVKEDGRCMVEIDTRMENMRGFITNVGPTTVELPSSEKLETGIAPVPSPAGVMRFNRNPDGLKVGDRVRVKAKQWDFPCDYPLSGQTGTINQAFCDVDGYFYVKMDNDCTTLDPRIVIALRGDQMERV